MKLFRKIPPPTVGIQSRKAGKNISETTRKRWQDQVGPGVHGYRPQGQSDTKIRIATECSRFDFFFGGGGRVQKIK